MLGGIFGTFFWPILVKYILKRNCLLIGVFFQSIFCYLLSFSTSVWHLFLCGFMSGTFTNIFTVGRDFLFEVSYNRIARILGFSLKSIFTLAANYIGPWIGVNIYNMTNKNF